MEVGDMVQVGNITIEKTQFGWQAFDGSLTPIPLPSIAQLGAQFWRHRDGLFRVPGEPGRTTHDKFTVCDAILAMVPGYDPGRRLL